MQATWNGHYSTVWLLLGPWGDNTVNPFAARLVRNHPLRSVGGEFVTELDLALLKSYVDTARVLGEDGTELIDVLFTSVVVANVCFHPNPCAICSMAAAYLLHRCVLRICRAMMASRAVLQCEAAVRRWHCVVSRARSSCTAACSSATESRWSIYCAKYVGGVVVWPRVPPCPSCPVMSRPDFVWSVSSCASL
jgi:hypothetical protein